MVLVDGISDHLEKICVAACARSKGKGSLRFLGKVVLGAGALFSPQSNGTSTSSGEGRKIPVRPCNLKGGGCCCILRSFTFKFQGVVCSGCGYRCGLAILPQNGNRLVVRPCFSRYTLPHRGLVHTVKVVGYSGGLRWVAIRLWGCRIEFGFEVQPAVDPLHRSNLNISVGNGGSAGQGIRIQDNIAVLSASELQFGGVIALVLGHLFLNINTAAGHHRRSGLIVVLPVLLAQGGEGDGGHCYRLGHLHHLQIKRRNSSHCHHHRQHQGLHTEQ